MTLLCFDYNFWAVGSGWGISRQWLGELLGAYVCRLWVVAEGTRGQQLGVLISASVCHLSGFWAPWSDA